MARKKHVFYFSNQRILDVLNEEKENYSIGEENLLNRDVTFTDDDVLAVRKYMARYNKCLLDAVRYHLRNYK